MKKPYITPTTVSMADVTDELLVVASRGVISEGYDIDYGGVDADGSQTPGARSSGKDIWDEE